MANTSPLPGRHRRPGHRPLLFASWRLPLAPGIWLLLSFPWLTRALHWTAGRLFTPGAAAHRGERVSGNHEGHRLGTFGAVPCWVGLGGQPSAAQPLEAEPTRSGLGIRSRARTCAPRPTWAATGPRQLPGPHLPGGATHWARLLVVTQTSFSAAVRPMSPWPPLAGLLAGRNCGPGRRMAAERRLSGAAVLGRTAGLMGTRVSGLPLCHEAARRRDATALSGVRGGAPARRRAPSAACQKRARRRLFAGLSRAARPGRATTGAWAGSCSATTGHGVGARVEEQHPVAGSRRAGGLTHGKTP
jgi:hypothetical protein